MIDGPNFNSTCVFLHTDHFFHEGSDWTNGRNFDEMLEELQAFYFQSCGRPCRRRWIDNRKGRKQGRGEEIGGDRARIQESSILGLGAESHTKIRFEWMRYFSELLIDRQDFEWLGCRW